MYPHLLGGAKVVQGCPLSKISNILKQYLFFAIKTVFKFVVKKEMDMEEESGMSKCHTTSNRN